ncbi:MAG: hypothetical protein ABUS48_06970, partial [Pseudomonadota bacterium]
QVGFGLCSAQLCLCLDGAAKQLERDKKHCSCSPDFVAFDDVKLDPAVEGEGAGGAVSFDFCCGGDCGSDLQLEGSCS